MRERRLGGVRITEITGEISAANSLVGSSDFDQIGNAPGDFTEANGIVALSNGSYVVISPDWDRGAIADAGAVTWGDGALGIQGSPDASNSLVGSSLNDHVGRGTDTFSGVTPLVEGNYGIRSASWDSDTVVDAGAVTWGSGATGINGKINETNSVLGSTTNSNIQYIFPNPFTSTFITKFVTVEGNRLFAISQLIGVPDPAPTITNFGGNITYTENAGPLAITVSPAGVSDVDSANFDTGTLTVTYTAGGSANDLLAIRNTTALTTDAGKVFYNSNEVGSFSGGVGTAPLVVTFTAFGTPTIAGVILRNIVYSNISDNPTATRTVSVQITDGDDGTSDGGQRR